MCLIICGMDVADKKAIGLRIKKIRLSLMITQTSFAAKLGISHAAISQYEMGDSLPSIKILIKISAIGDVTLDWLILGR